MDPGPYFSCFRFFALYKGLLPKILRFGPGITCLLLSLEPQLLKGFFFIAGGAIMLVVYEQASHYLETEWGF